MSEITIPVNDARIQYTASAGQTVFPYDFSIFDQNHIIVLQTVAATNVTSVLTVTTHYTIDGVGLQNGGNVTLVSGAIVNDTITIYRATPVERTSDFNQAGDFNASTLNRELDTFAQIEQQLDRDLGRTVGLKPEDVNATTTLPVKDSRKDKFLSFDANGNVETIVDRSAFTLAKTSETNAASSATNAATSETNASTSASSASTSSTNASTSETLAGDWANKAEDSIVANGEYSAKHYSKKAQAASNPNVKATASDTTPGFLDSKLVTTSALTKTTLNPGADEDLQLDLADNAVTAAKINNDAVTLAKLASGTSGNLISYDASGDPVSVTTGTAAQILTSNGVGLPPTFQPAGGGGAWTLISRQESGSDVTSIDFDTVFDTSYEAYRIIGWTVSSAMALLQARVTDDDGTTYEGGANYLYNTYRISTVETNNNGSSANQANISGDNTSGQGILFDLTVTRYTSNAAETNLQWNGHVSGGTNNEHGLVFGHTQGLSGVDGIQFFYSAGNIRAGSWIYVLGLNTS